ncbi:hypothetical protein, partial [Aggregatibacter aphrophilus]|uniref:hypothetical protein n=1 Tax=Aggregatibacter aphrophilus TaxID=732 RepID=UPI00022FEFC0
PYVPVPGEKGEEKINVEITVQQRDVESLYVEIIRIAPDTIKSGQILKRFQLAKSDEKKLKEGKGKVEVGTYLWEWDGYIDDVLDTKLLKDETTYIRVVGVIGSAFRDDAVQLLAQPFKECAEPVDWLDVIVNRKKKTVNVEWRVAFYDGGVSGKANADTPSFEELKRLAIEGIKKHWGGQIHTTKGSYVVTVNPVLAMKKAAPSLTLRVSNDPRGDRSVNASCACGILPRVTRGITDLIDDIIPSLDMTVIWYLNGIIDWDESYKVLKFMQTAAHESGHPILANYAYKSTGLNNYSWVHKGSSKGVMSGYSIPKYGEKGHEPYPLGKADLMKYYAYGNIYPDDYQSTEIDIKSLIWLSRIKSQGILK